MAKADLSSVPMRYRNRIRINGECWDWTGSRMPEGVRAVEPEPVRASGDLRGPSWSDPLRSDA